MSSSRSAQRHPTFPSELSDLRYIEAIDQHIPGAFPTEMILRQKKEGQTRTLPPPSTVDEIQHVIGVFGDFAKHYLPDSVCAYIGMWIHFFSLKRS